MKVEKEIINREISWLSFNERVLQEAGDKNVPLVQRIRFLGIFSNNLDEFFRVRVATINRVLNFGKSAKELLGAKPKKLMGQIHDIVIRHQERSLEIYNDILTGLEKENIFILDETELSKEQAVFVKDHFHRIIRPTLVPVMLYKHADFPYLREKSIYLAVKFVGRKSAVNPYSLIEIPTTVHSRFIVLPEKDGKKYIMLIDDVIRFSMQEIFEVLKLKFDKAFTIKITRDAELNIDNDLSRSLVDKISRSIKQRKKGDAVRFVYDQTMPRQLLDFIIKSMKFNNSDNLIPGGRYHNFKDFINFPNVGGKHLEYQPSPIIPNKYLHPTASIINVLKKRDVLLHYPYQSFSSFIDLLREAAIDPKVVSIKITAYRLAKKSNVINALISAVKNGKDVTAVMEIQARFDEEANIQWSNALQEEGVKVIYGVPGLKVHSKMCLIKRKEGGKFVQYACVGTGNFNEQTATLYSDHSLFTSRKEITSEVSKLFDFFENNLHLHKYQHLVVSPLSMRKKMVAHIDKEIKNAKAGKPAYMILKMNNLVDIDLIKKLYVASKAGVNIKLIIRGICSLIPGIKGMSENIEAVSIVDRYLEHSRIFVFCNGGNELYYFSSADWMTRNLDYRVEVTCPVYDKELQEELRTMLNIQLSGNVKARIIDEFQTNRYKKRDNSKIKIRSQVAFYNYLKEKHGKV
jgi:polyphosphate kinase